MSKQLSVAAQRELEWRDRLARQAMSGQTIATFCRSEAITEGTFYAWRAGLRARNPEVSRVKGTTKAPAASIDVGAINGLVAELGTKQIGIVQSLIVTCRLNQIDPYTYLVDVLQRVGSHPHSLVDQLTSRLWKQHFADKPLRSDSY